MNYGMMIFANFMLGAITTCILIFITRRMSFYSYSYYKSEYNKLKDLQIRDSDRALLSRYNDNKSVFDSDRENLTRSILTLEAGYEKLEKKVCSIKMLLVRTTVQFDDELIKLRGEIKGKKPAEKKKGARGVNETDK